MPPPPPPRYFRRPVKERRLISASSLNGEAGVISTKNSTPETDFPPMDDRIPRIIRLPVEKINLQKECERKKE